MEILEIKDDLVYIGFSNYATLRHYAKIFQKRHILKSNLDPNAKRALKSLTFLKSENLYLPKFF